MGSVYKFIVYSLLIGLLFLIFANTFASIFWLGILLGQLTWALLCPRYVNTYRPMKVFGVLCKRITLVYLVVVIFLVCLWIHIWILLILIVDHSRFYPSAERSGKGKVTFIQIVHFAFVSHLIDQLVVMLSKGVGIHMLVML